MKEKRHTTVGTRNHRHPGSIGAWLAGVTISFTGFFLAAQDSVVIEGGPNKVHLSDRDGEMERPRTVPPAETPEAGISNPANPFALSEERAFTVERPVPGEEFRIITPVIEEPVTAPAGTAGISGDVSATVRPEGETSEEIDVEELRRLAAMERELGIRTTATGAAIAYDAEDVFEAGTPAIEGYARPTLSKLADYLATAEGDRIAIEYRYLKEEETEEASRKRAAALAGFLEREAGGRDLEISLPDPRPVEKPVVEDGRFNGRIDPELKSLILITLERSGDS